MIRVIQADWIVAGLSALAMVGCSQSGVGGAAKARLSAGQVARLQNSAGCLDLVKVLQSFNDAKVVKLGTTDIQLAADGAPVSKEFEWDLKASAMHDNEDFVKSGERMRESQKKNMDGAQQVGCEKVVGTHDGKAFEYKITRSSPTLVEFGVANDGQPDAGTIKTTMELVSDGELRISWGDSDFSIPHTCGASSQSVNESHSVKFVSTATWGDTAADPELSATVKTYMAQAKAAGGDGSDDYWKADSADYCQATGHQ